MSQKEVAIVGRNNTKAAVTGQEELLIRINSVNANDTSIIRTHNILRETLAGTIVNPYSFSIANVGSATGTVETMNLNPGEIINFDAGALNNKFGTITYDPTGTEFLITWVS
jgi:hypothetical protein